MKRQSCFPRVMKMPYFLGVGKNEFKRAMHALIDALECDWAEKVAPIESIVKNK